MKYFVITIAVLALCSCKKNEITIAHPLAEISGQSYEDIEMSNELPSPKRNNNNLSIIPIPREKDIPTDSIVDDYTFIPLETTDSSLLGRIDKICTDDNNIFILDIDNKKALQFDNTGKFLRIIGKQGRGPHEYNDIWDMSIDTNSKRICLLDLSGRKLLYFDYAGHCVKEEPMYFLFRMLEFDNQTIILNTGNSYNDNNPAVNLYQLTITNNKQIPLCRDFPLSKERRESFSYVPSRAIKKFSDGIYYCDILSDTIWKVTEQEISSAFALKFRRNNIFSMSDLEQMNDYLYSEKTENVSEQFFGGNYLITNNYAYFLIQKDKKIKSLIYNRKNKNILYGNFIRSKESNRLGDYMTSFYFDFVVNDSTFTSVLQPYTIKSLVRNLISPNNYKNIRAADRAMVEKLDDEDNPVLMLVKLKNF